MPKIKFVYWLPLVLLLIVVGIPLGSWIHTQWRDRTRQGFERQCREASRKKDWKTLAQSAEAWSRWDPRQADGWLYRAEAAEGEQDLSSAAEFLGHVPDDDRRVLGALVSKSRIEFEILNRPLDGVSTCDRILSIDPRVTIAHKQSIFFYALTLQRPEMIHRIRRAIELRRESPEAYVYLAGAHWIYFGNLYQLNSRWLQSNPGNELFEVARAMQVYKSNAKENPERAADFVDIPDEDGLLKRYPHNVEVIALHLERQMADGNLDRVQELLDAAPLTLADLDARFWLARAWCFDNRDDFESAEFALERAVQIDPYWWRIHFQMQEVFRRQGKSSKAAKASQLYDLGKQLSKMIMEMRDAAEPSSEFCMVMLQMAKISGDKTVADALSERYNNQ